MVNQKKKSLMVQKDDLQDTSHIDALFEHISVLIEQARKRVVTAANIAEVYTKFEIGRYIIEDEQKGEYRAQYGKQILKTLSAKLTERFGKGWSVDTLEKCRTFFNVYSISATVFRKCCKQANNQSKKRGSLQNSETLLRNFTDDVSFSLSWSHYLILMRINNPDARSFYEIECVQQQWSVRQLGRQVGSSLYERLALSRDKSEVILPDKAMLQAKVKEWINEFNEANPEALTEK